MRKEDVVYTYNGILLSAGKKEILPLVTMWMEPEGVALRESSQTNTVCVTCVWNLSKLSLQGRRQDGGYQRGCGGTGAMRVPGYELT